MKFAFFEEISKIQQRIFLFMMGTMNSIIVGRFFSDIIMVLVQNQKFQPTLSALPYFNEYLAPQLIFYVIGSLFIGFSLLLVIILPKHYILQYSPSISYLFINCIACYIIFSQIPQMGILGIFFYFIPHLLTKQSIHYFNTILKIFPVLFFIGISVVVFRMYRDVTFNPPVVLNQFFRIPELYNINHYTPNSASHFVSTTDIQNTNSWFGDREKLDILTYPQWKNNRACFLVEENMQTLVELSETYNFESQIYKNQVFEAIKHPERITYFAPIVIYKEDTLCIIPADGSYSAAQQITAANEKLYNELQKAKIYIPQPLPFLKKIDSLNQKTLHSIYGAINDKYSRDFSFEQVFQYSLRGEIKHHMVYLTPALEYLLGKPLSKISHQYGLGFTLSVAYANKIFTPESTISYGGYLRVAHWFWIITFFLYLPVFFIILKNFWLSTIPILLLLLSRFAIGFEPTLEWVATPYIRTLFIPFCFCLIFYYFKSYSLKGIFFSLICIFISLLMNFDFSFFLCLALIGTLLVDYFYTKIKNNIIFLLCLIFLIIVSLPISKIGTHYIAAGFLSGLFSGNMHIDVIIGQLILFFIKILLFLIMKSRQSKFANILLCYTFYGQMLSCYFIWFGDTNHYLIYLPEHMMPFVLFFAFIFIEHQHSQVIKTLSYFICVFFIIGQMMPYAKSFYFTERAYNRGIASHQLYYWEYPGTHFNSTMNPKYFEDAIKKIQRYSSQEEKRIFMISQYDCFLAFLTQKYSGLPHYDLMPFLFSQKHISMVEESFRDNKPQYIFVDSDIDVPSELDITSVAFWGPYLRSESMARVAQLKDMHKIYDAIKENYKLVESGPMISVYERIL